MWATKASGCIMLVAWASKGNKSKWAINVLKIMTESEKAQTDGKNSQLSGASWVTNCSRNALTQMGMTGPVEAWSSPMQTKCMSEYMRATNRKGNVTVSRIFPELASEARRRDMEDSKTHGGYTKM